MGTYFAFFTESQENTLYLIVGQIVVVGVIPFLCICRFAIWFGGREERKNRREQLEIQNAERAEKRKQFLEKKNRTR
jgi:hypothetical protein